MTICIAALCHVQGANDATLRAIVTASDRMMTAGDVQYEPPQRKISFITKNAIILVSGDIVTQTAILRETVKRLAGREIVPVEELADIYGQCLQSIRAQRSEREYLSPLGLDLKSFIRSQKDIDPEIARELTGKLLSYPMDIEAIVAGAEDNNAHIYHVDSDGMGTIHDDVGFIAIGSGSSHAKPPAYSLKRSQVPSER